MGTVVSKRFRPLVVALVLAGSAIMLLGARRGGVVLATVAETLTPDAYLPLLRNAPPAETPIPPDDPGQELAVAALINQQRRAHGLPDLITVDSLTQAARRHSRDMADQDFTSHTGSDGSNGGQRMREAGYDWSAWGEIIAWGFGGDAQSVVDWWMNSPPHRALILSGTYTDFGVGYAYQAASTYRHYWTVNFGRPAGESGTGDADGQTAFCYLVAIGPDGGSSVQFGLCLSD